MSYVPGGEKVADYAYLKRGHKYWNIWIGNPLGIGLYRIPLTVSRSVVINKCITAQKKAKRNFIKRFPEIPWKS